MSISSNLYQSRLEHVPGFFQVNVPTQCLAQDMRGMPADSTGSIEVAVQRIAVGRMHTVVDDHPSPFPWRQTAQVGKAHFGDQNVDIMLSVVHMADHRHHAGNGAALGDRLGHEDGQVRIAREVPGAANTVHHPRATHGWN